MDAETLIALRWSIRHWEENLAAPSAREASVSDRDCALCRDFIQNHCKGCPVYASSGSRYCHNTPYEAAERAFYDWKRHPHPEWRDRWREAARAQLNFLKSLLPLHTRSAEAAGDTFLGKDYL